MAVDSVSRLGADAQSFVSLGVPYFDHGSRVSPKTVAQRKRRNEHNADKGRGSDS